MQIGAVYNVGGRLAGGWGFAARAVNGFVPSAANLADLVSAITAFARQDGGTIFVQQMPNGFLPANAIGAGPTKRTRTSTCPAAVNMLQYSTANVPTDINYATDLRWTTECTSVS